MVETDAGSSAGDSCFEDFTPGTVREFGSTPVTEEEIIAFAKQYDPQVFHTDPDAARKGMYGGLIASGWHTAAMAMRLLVDHQLSHMASLGSPGIDELRWLRPVRPGDKLSVRVTVEETRRSQSKPDRGLVRLFIEVMNQNREVVMSWRGINMLRCRLS
ncbi:MAG: Bifunctional protein PaaZ [Syntrophorhabdus sp. PtaU1.Bin153]|nr:MAG: Bifunctional protein PaaZ [Syntrophorhabdus sp. PtaU1.Bin153]